MSDVTILITLKDRCGYTYRLMGYLNNIKCPFKVLLADGGSNKALENDLRNHINYPDVDYRYIRYPYDVDFLTYYTKMKNSALEVDTPFVMCIDNDDLIIPEGVQKCVDFLKTNDSYAASRGALEGFACDSIPEPSDYQGNLYTEFPDDITGDSAATRFIDQSQHFHSNSHNVMKTKHLILECSVVEELNLKNLRFVEQLRGFLNVLWGNCNRETHDYLLHQHGTPRVSGGENQFVDQNGWITDGPYFYWPEEFAKMTDGIASGIAVYDNIDIDEARELVREHYTKMYCRRVSNTDLLKQQVRKSREYYLSHDELEPVINHIEAYYD